MVDRLSCFRRSVRNLFDSYGEPNLSLPGVLFTLLRIVRDFGGAAAIVGTIALWELGSWAARPDGDYL